MAGSRDGELIEWARKQAREEKDFQSHLIAYVVVIGFLFVLDLITGSGFWFYWPALGWGVGLTFHAIQVYSGRRGPDTVERRTEELLRRTRAGSAPAPARPPAAPGHLSALIEAGRRDVSAMRSEAKRIQDPDIRDQALGVCVRADSILFALSEPGRDELLAREFVDQVLSPARSLFENYVRLSERRIASAAPALRRVESRDLPLLETTLLDIHDRLHQDDLVSLEVASEMLSLGRALDVNVEAETGERR
jgi:hypothetical protein